MLLTQNGYVDILGLHTKAASTRLILRGESTFHTDVAPIGLKNLF